MRWFVVVVLVFFLSAGFGFAAELAVPMDYPTIQAAVDAAKDGSYIWLSPGVYRETVEWRGKSLGIMARPGTATIAGHVLVGGGYRPGKTIVILEGLRIVNPEKESVSHYNKAAVFAELGVALFVRNCVIASATNGISANYCYETVVEDCTIEGQGCGAGIRVSNGYADDVRLRNNSIWGFAAPVNCQLVPKYGAAWYQLAPLDQIFYLYLETGELLSVVAGDTVRIVNVHVYSQADNKFEPTPSPFVSFGRKGKKEDEGYGACEVRTNGNTPWTAVIGLKATQLGLVTLTARRDRIKMDNYFWTCVPAEDYWSRVRSDQPIVQLAPGRSSPTSSPTMSTTWGKIKN